MAAVRLVELSPYACAVVYSSHGIVKWAKRSKTFRERVPEGMNVPERSQARQVFDGRAIPDVASHHAARAWLSASSKIAAGVDIVEHAMVVPEPGWGGVLSLLWIPSTEPTWFTFDHGEAALG
jgi:hypothetical protein